MKSGLLLLAGGMAATALQLVSAQTANMTLPKTVEAGSAFSIQTTGSGKAILYIVGPGQVLKRDIQLGSTTMFSVGSLYNAGRYLAMLTTDSSNESDTFDVVALSKPATLSFLAKPSRLPVGLHDGITGAAYVFDTYGNLIATPTPVSFELTGPSGSVQKRVIMTRDGAAWTSMDSTAQQGMDRFTARIGDVSNTRIVGQVAGDPCGLRMSARQAGQQLQLVTDPVRDCSGNAVPDGTIVTFTEAYNGVQSTVDVPLKRGIAEVQIAGHPGATLSVASGVVMGNQIRWER